MKLKMMELLAAVVMLLQIFTSAQAVDWDKICTARKESYGRSWLESQRVLPPMEAHFIKMVFCEEEDVVVQFYEEIDSKKMSYSLVWQQYISPVYSDRYVKREFQLDEPIQIKDTYRVAVYTVDKSVQQVPVSTQRISEMVMTNSEEIRDFAVKTPYTFSDVFAPYTFQLEFCGKDGCPPDVSPTAPSTTPKPDYQCKADGSDMVPTDGKVLLVKGRPLVSGMAKAMSTYFCADVPVTVQLWRPVEDEPNEFVLVWEKEIKARQGLGYTANINFERDEYIYIDETYRLGLKGSVGANIPIPTKFNPEGKVVRSKSDNGDDFGVCSSVEFDDLTFPRSFEINFCANLDCADEGGDRTDRATVDIPCPDSSSEGEGEDSGTEENSEEGNEGSKTSPKTSKPGVVTPGPGIRSSTREPKVGGSKSSACSPWKATSIVFLLSASLAFIRLHQHQ